MSYSREIIDSGLLPNETKWLEILSILKKVVFLDKNKLQELNIGENLEECW